MKTVVDATEAVLAASRAATDPSPTPTTDEDEAYDPFASPDPQARPDPPAPPSSGVRRIDLA